MIRMLLVCVCLVVLTGRVMADPLMDARHAYDAGNYADAGKLSRPLAEQGAAPAQFILGMMYVTGNGYTQDEAEAVKWFRQAADQGFAEAQYQLGMIYEAGSVVGEDDNEAVKWYRLSAEQGHAPAQLFLGKMYRNGRGVPQDFVRAYMWISVAGPNASKSPDLSKILLEGMERQMTPDQVTEARELARKCTANKFKGC